MANERKAANLNDVQKQIAQALQHMIDREKKDPAHEGWCYEYFENIITIEDRSYCLTGAVAYYCEEEYDYTHINDPYCVITYVSSQVEDIEICDFSIRVYDDIEDIEIPSDINKEEILQSLNY